MRSFLLVFTIAFASHGGVYAQFDRSRHEYEVTARAFLKSSQMQSQGHISKDRLEAYWDELAQHGLPVRMPYLVLVNNSSVGDVGILPDGIIDRTLEISYKVLSQTKDGTLIRVIRERDTGTHLGGVYLFKNAPTTNVPNDGYFEPTGYWQITGTYDYPVVLGSERRALIVEPLSEADANMPKKLKHKLLFEHEPREWKNADGTTASRGIYLGYKKSLVWTMSEESEIRKIDLFKLSKADQDFVRKEIKEGRRLHLIPEIEKEFGNDAKNVAIRGDQ